jgi:two-component system, NtrC family, response regulator AtoC
VSGSLRSADDVLTAGPQDAERASGGLSLRAVGEAFAAWHPLPPSGEVLVGRSAEADIALDHPSVSRRHARIHLGPPLAIEDLGSANGTSVRGSALRPGERRPIAIGEAIDVGSILVVVQHASSTASQARPCAHAVFERKLEEACARANQASTPLSVVRLHVGGAIVARAAEEALMDALASSAVVGSYAPGEYEVLVEGAAPAEALQRTAPAVEQLRSKGALVRTGVAGLPLHGRTPEALMTTACAEVRGTARADAAPAIEPAGKMADLSGVIDKVAPGMITVLIMGETGAGKEVAAELLHRRSRRAGKPFLKLNCAALTPTLLESELFGHEKGSFTGAAQAKRGLLETAQGGTVLFDEVGELPISIQIKLLRVLEEHAVLPVGGLSPRPIDVRFLAATNRPLDAEVARGTFRQDLFYRLSGVTLVVPPLRERLEELEALATAFVARAARDMGWEAPQISEGVLSLLRRHRWPGNVRELRNVMERAVLLAAGSSVITEDHVPKEKILDAPEPREPAAAGGPISEAGERERILEALARCAGNQTQAARLLGMSRGTLVTRLEAYNLPRPQKRRR